MKTGVCFYGNLQKGQTLLACVQAAISGVAKDASRGHAASRNILDRYLAELEEIESDIVALINLARADADTSDDRDSPGSNGLPGTVIL